MQWCMQYHLILDCVIMAPDCSYETSKELCLTWWSSLCLLMAQYNYIKFRFRLACEHWRAEGSYMHNLFVYMYMYVCLCATNLFINVSSAILLFATNSKTYILGMVLRDFLEKIYLDNFVELDWLIKHADAKIRCKHKRPQESDPSCWKE